MLSLFIPTFFFVSLTPGMCMTLSMTLGMQIGFRKTLWMMLGELLGVALVAIASVIGVAAILLQYPAVFTLLKWLGGVYLMFIGVNMWLSKGKMSVQVDPLKQVYPGCAALMGLGFTTAVFNPKGWAFFVALLPPFIDATRSLPGQLTRLIVIILVIEFLCLCLYCAGGKTLRFFLQNPSHVKLLNRVSGTLMIGVAFWLALG